MSVRLISRKSHVYKNGRLLFRRNNLCATIATMLTVNSYRHRYNGKELYLALVRLYPAIRILRKNRKNPQISEQFVERLMLAVTEVNQCVLCSYAHTRMALEKGLSENEIESLLSGSSSHIQKEEATAIWFVQSFADNQGTFDQTSYDSLVEEYGTQKSATIIAAARVMMVGNIFGLPWSAFLSRLKGQRYTNSSLFYELSMMLASILFIPFSALHALFTGIWKLFTT